MKSDLRRQVLLNAIQQEIQRGRPQRAQQLLLRLLKLEPDNQEAWLTLADTFEEPAKTIRALEQLLQLNPQHAVAKKRLAQLKELEATAQIKAELTTAENGRSLHWTRWLLLPLLIGFLAGVSYLGWALLTTKPSPPLQIERTIEEAEGSQPLANLVIEEEWDCVYEEESEITQFYGRVQNQHEAETLRGFTLRVVLLANDLSELSSNLGRENDLSVAPGETAAFSIPVANPTGSNICLIERVEATFSE